MKYLAAATIAVCFVGVLASPASADSIAFSASDAEGRSASATFAHTGTYLSITLSNTSSADALLPVDILTGLFFDISSGAGLTPLSAVLGGVATVHFGSSDGGSVGGEWAYASNLSGPGGASYGIGSAGLGLFTPGDRFDTGSNLQGAESVNGLEFGITTAGDDVTTGNTPVTGAHALIQGSVVFFFTVGSGFDLDDISNVSFQYGTSLSEPNITEMPEPGTLLLLGTGLAGLAASVRRRRRHRA
jgi:hypothetical protein